MVVFAWMHYKAFPWWEFKYKSLSSSPICYDYAQFGGLDELKSSRNNSPNPGTMFSTFGAFDEDKEMEDEDEEAIYNDVQRITNPMAHSNTNNTSSHRQRGSRKNSIEC